MTTARVLAVVALVLAAVVGLAELGYFFSHQYRPGVSPHLIGLSAAVVLLAIARILTPRE
jgi:membrane protein YdbS with pleckstrin-like domain